MTLETYVYAFLALLVSVVLILVIMHIVDDLLDTMSANRWKPDNLDDYDQYKGTPQYFSGSEDTYADIDKHIDSLISKWEQSRKTT